MKAENWIERYVYQIGRHLPRNIRTDVQRELYSLLQEAFWERLEQSPEENEEQIVLNLLREFGKPEDIAQRYMPRRALVSPETYPYYLIVLQVVLGIQTLVFFVLTAYSLMRQQTDAPLTIIGSAGAKWLETVLLNVGLITLIFAIIERLESQRPQKVSQWDPRSLPEIKDPNQINRGELVAGIVFLSLFIVLLNFFPQWVGLAGFAGEAWGIVSLLSPEFNQHIPWLTVAWLLDILVKVYTLGRGRWQLNTRIAEWVVALFGFYVLYRIVNGGEIVTISILSDLMKVGLRVVLVIEAVDILSKLYRLVTGQKEMSWQLKLAKG